MLGQEGNELMRAAAVIDVAGDALLTLASGDTVLFQGISEFDFESHYGL